MKNLRNSLLIASALSLPSFSSVAHAQNEVATDPVGFVKVEVAADSDKRLAVPFTTPIEFAGQATEISGNVITFEGASFTANQFVPNGTTQTKSYLLRVTEGTAHGKWYTVTANAPTTVTVDPGQAATLQQQGFTTTHIQKATIYPFWTLSTLFPQGSIVASTDPFAPNGTMILVNDPAAAGTDITPAFAYFYHDGSSGLIGAGWYNAANVFSGNVNNLILPPDQHFVIRNKGAARMISLIGSVLGTEVGTELVRHTSAQDNMITQPFPVPVSPTELGLVQSGAFKVSKDVFAPEGDFLLQYDSQVTGFDQTPSKSYIYHDGSSEILTAGWYSVQNVFGGSVTNQKLFDPAEGLVVRKAAGTPLLTDWTAQPPF